MRQRANAAGNEGEYEMLARGQPATQVGQNTNSAWCGGFSDAAVLIELCDLVRQRMDSCCASLIVPRLPLEHSTLRTAGA